jgi:hypothetical protein
MVADHSRDVFGADHVYELGHAARLWFEHVLNDQDAEDAAHRPEPSSHSIDSFG